MSKLIKGIHHVSLKSFTDEDYQKGKEFYGDLLGLKKVREWSDGIMYDTGAGIIEIFNNGTEKRQKGMISHYAFACEDIDTCIDKIRKAGYEIFIEPEDTFLDSEPIYPIRIAFCIGPFGEEIEFLKEI